MFVYKSVTRIENDQVIEEDITDRKIVALVCLFNSDLSRMCFEYTDGSYEPLGGNFDNQFHICSDRYINVKLFAIQKVMEQMKYEIPYHQLHHVSTTMYPENYNLISGNEDEVEVWLFTSRVRHKITTDEGRNEDLSMLFDIEFDGLIWKDVVNLDKLVIPAVDTYLADYVSKIQTCKSYIIHKGV